MIPIEEGKALITFLGRKGNLQPKSLNEIKQRILQFENKDFSNYLENCDAMSDTHSFYNTFNELRVPHHNYKNLIVLGDALCCLNPTYGQGMSLALKSTQLLQQQLNLHKFSQKSFVSIYKKSFYLSAAEDFYVEQAKVEGLGIFNRMKLHLQHALTQSLLLCATRSTLVHKFFLKELHLLKKTPSEQLV